MTDRQRNEEWRKMHIDKVRKELNLTRLEYQEFLRLGKELNKIYTWACNGYRGEKAFYNGKELTNRYESEQEERDSQPIEKKAVETAKAKGLYIFFQTDPRGATIYLDKKPIDYDRYTDAYCIY